MKRLIIAALALGLAAPAALAETQKQHEAACIAGTVTGAVLGAALGGFFGNGAGKAVMQVALGGGGAYLAHKHSCKKS